MNTRDKIILLILLSLLVVLINVASLSAQFAGGEGTEEDPYLVETAQHLYDVRYYLDSYFRQISDIDLSGHSGGDGWEPIYGFEGTYYGSGYTINNLIIDRPNEDNVGLFSYTENATVIGIGLVDVSIIGNDNVGSIIGCSKESKVALNYVTGEVIGKNNVGGLIGLQLDGILSEIYVITDVEGSQNIGGLVGAKESGLIENCYSMGNVTGEKNIGGLIGCHDENSMVVNSYSIGQVTGKDDVGGLIGYGNGTVTNSYWDIEISGRLSSSGGEGRTTEEMTYPYDLDTYVDWNFVAEWVSDENEYHEGYPYLLCNPRYDIRYDFSGGSGTENDPYIIATATDLNHIRGVHLNDYFLQAADIDLSTLLTTPDGWKPIGTYGFSFWGAYNGNGYTIDNLYINRPTENYIGLFGSILQASLSNINLQNIDITGYYDVGGLVGRTGGYYENNILYGSFIEYCSSSGEVNGFIGNGGLIGRVYRTIIEYSHSSADISSTLNEAGGLIGALETDGIISHCYATGNVVGYLNVGGLVGNTSGPLAIHESETKIVDSYATGNVEGEIAVGGLVGVACGSPLVGQSYVMIIENCYATGNVISNNSNSGGVGGLVGQNWGSYLISSYASGKVSGSAIKVGGLVGRNSRLYYNSQYCGIGGQIIDCYATGAVEGLAEVGGLVGFNAHIQGVSCVIQDSYSIGLVNGGNPGQDIGGLIGTNEGIVDNSYWDRVTSGHETSDGGSGAVTVDMVLSNTLYTNWDFQSIWDMEDYTTYPYLRWQEDPGIHNYPIGGHHKTFQRREYYWESFPVLWNRNIDGWQSAQEVLEPLTYNYPEHNHIEVWNESEQSMFWDGDEWLDDYDIYFHSTRGYQISFGIEDEFELIVQGDIGTPQNIPFDTEMTIYPQNIQVENWIGYFIPQTQYAELAFHSISEYLKEVQAEEWGMYKLPEGGWIHDGNEYPTVVFGKMYKVIALYPEVTTSFPFNWPVPSEIIHEQSRSQPEYFVFEEKASYESFFIEEIEDDHDILEIAVYADDECVGASVFHNNYPIEILAYTDESHVDANISFAIYRNGQRGETERVRVVDVKNIYSGEYTSQVVKPLRQSFTIVRLGAGEYEPETEIKPEISLSQNYPNPVKMTSAVRSDLTQIPFYIPEDRKVTLTVYNIKGQLVKTLYDCTASAGKHSIGWNGLNEHNRQVGSGIYLYRLETEDKQLTKKMLLIR